MAGLASLVCAACSGGTPSASSVTSPPPSLSAAPSTPAPGTPAPSPSGSASAPDPIATSDAAGTLGYAAVCSGSGSASAAAYAGPGPHPVDFEGDAAFYDGSTDVTDNDGSLLATSSGDIEPAGWTPASAARVQLVACVTTDYTTTKVGSCQYSSGSLPLEGARYTLTLYAARTGRKLAGPDTVQGSDRTCPATVLSGSGDQHPAVFTSLGLNQIEAIIGKYVA